MFRLLKTASFRLATIYLTLFTLSALALGAFAYISIRYEVLAGFDERIIEETDALRSLYAAHGPERLRETLEARGSSGGGFTYGLIGSDGSHLAGELDAPLEAAGRRSGWIEAREPERDESPEGKPEIVRALVSPLPDGSTLIVGDEQRRPDQLLKSILSAFGWAILATLLLGVLGGLWISAQFLKRIDTMRQSAQAIMAGDWSRRIPYAPVNDDLSALARTFNRLFERIEKLLLANRHVSADIAHDLRKPLASILRRLEAARSGESSPDQMLIAIQASTTGIEEVLRTFNALLRIGEVESGARRAAFRPVDLSEIANKVVDAYQPAAEEEGIRLATHLDTALLMQGDKELLSQMIANLLDNALRYTPGGGRVEVIGERTSRGVSLSVSDDGPGVPPKDLKAIFRRFYRVDPTTQKSAGTGLGLSLVAAIAELHELDYSASDNHPGLRVTLTTTNEEI